MDPVLLEVYRHRFIGISEEMGVTLQRTSFSPNIKERLDFSCALFDGAGKLIAQAAHIPVHLGAMPASVKAARDAYSSWHPGDVVILNDPYAGGTHLPDITMVTPVFGLAENAPLYFIATRAHHADVGGMTPGSLPLSTELYQEGIIIPPVMVYEKGVLNEGVQALILRNVRTPKEREGDFAAQRAAHTVGNKRLSALMSQFGEEEVALYARHLQSYSERIVRAAISSWPDGVYTSEDILEVKENARIKLKLTIQGDRISFDFTGTSGSMQNSLNAVLSITQSACYYTVACLVGEDVPMNEGCFSQVHIDVPKGSLLNARPPSAVAGGNVETSQRVVDVAFKAFAKALPERVLADSQGTMNNLTIGGISEEGRPYAYYETIGGGMGASLNTDGLSGVHVHMSNTLNTPVEALERAYPFRIKVYSLRKGSGGLGQRNGGEGLIREYELLRPATVTMLSERRSHPPAGLFGGKEGETGKNMLIEANGEETELPAKFSRVFQAGECLRIITPGGGGYGPENE
ncbi:MAG: hydantoinase B/oxoprolinase family protein [Rhodothermaceae bacterium]|nr:hydantoinase B/oxoprolinase family protein [Rhodothermaceae bacterium]